MSEFTEFRREYRYVVFKRSDMLSALPDERRKEIWDLAGFVDMHRVTEGKRSLECVVVESDWPEYESVWGMIEDRVNKTPNAIERLESQNAAMREALGKIADSNTLLASTTRITARIALQGVGE